MKKLAYSVMALISLAHYCHAESPLEKPFIFWLEADYPPAYFLGDKVSHQGFAQIAKNSFIQSLPDFQHTTLVMNNKRLKKYLANPKKIYCIAQAGIDLNEIPSIKYSKVANVVPGVGIVVRKEQRQLFVEDYDASLEKLIDVETLKLGNVSEGFYGGSINKLLEKYREKAHIITRHSSTNSTAFYKLLINKRLDYFLDYGFSYQFNMQDVQYRSLSFIELSEQSEAKKAYAFCNNHPRSQEVIDGINRVLVSEQYRQEQSEELLKYVPDSLKTSYQKLNELIGK